MSTDIVENKANLEFYRRKKLSNKGIYREIGILGGINPFVVYNPLFAKVSVSVKLRHAKDCGYQNNQLFVTLKFLHIKLGNPKIIFLEIKNIKILVFR